VSKQGVIEINSMDLNESDQWSAELQRLFANIPVFDGLRPKDFTITRLPGYTNRNYRLHNSDHDWVLRLPRPSTDLFIDRVAEAQNQTIAYHLGLAPQVLWRNDKGVSLTPTLSNSRNLQHSDFSSDQQLALIVKPLQQLHRSGQRFSGQADLGYTLARHYDLLDTSQQRDYKQRMAQARRTLSLLEVADQGWVPSHRDPVLGNLLLTDERLWLIDWEYSAMASPYWDLAILCNEADLDLPQSRRLLQAYCVGGPAMQESLLFDYRGLLKLLNDCWMSALADS
jgi:thiamine kinase-like enzyme